MRLIAMCFSPPVHRFGGALGENIMDFSDEEIFEKTAEIWSTMLGIDPERGPEVVLPDGKNQTVSGCVQITGEWIGAVTVDCPAALARKVAAAMFEMEEDEAGADEIQDALGEITNMTAGNVKAMISPTLTIAPPSVVEGVDYKVRIPGTELVHQTFFQCDGVPFGVSIHQKT